MAGRVSEAFLARWRALPFCLFEAHVWVRDPAGLDRCRFIRQLFTADEGSVPVICETPYLVGGPAVGQGPEYGCLYMQKMLGGTDT